MAIGTVDGGAGNGDSAGGLVGFNGGTTMSSYGFGTAMNGENSFSPVARSGDASPPATVPGATALTELNSSIGVDGIDGNTDDNDWPTRVWYFGTTSERPVLKWITDFNSSGATDVLRYPCDMALLPPGATCGGNIPGQDTR